MASSEPSTAQPGAATPRRRGALALALAALFAVALSVFTQHNRYPYFYHPDEYGKCKQIVDGKRNFNHPLLLLNTAQPLKKLWGKSPSDTKPEQLQKAVEAGRTASAIFAALAVVALVVAAYVLAGPGGALGTGLVVLFHPLLFEHAHIFKEDTSLMAGLGLSFMAAALFIKDPSPLWRAALMGASAALAGSGKYVGFTALLIVLPLAAFTPGEHRKRRLMWFAGAFLLTFILVNYQMFTHLGEWAKSFQREAGYSVSGARGMAAQDPAGYYMDWFWRTVPPVAVFFLFINLFNLLTTARRRSLGQWLLFLFPVAFTGMLMLSPRVSDRYFLPPAVLFNFNAMVGVGLAAEWFTRAFRGYRLAGQLAFAALAVSIGWRGPISAFERTVAQFKVDDRRDLEQWLAKPENAPAGSIIAQDASVGLPDPEHHKQKGLKREFPHNVLSEEFAADLGTLDELRAKGVRFLATTPKKSDRYTSGAMIPTEDGREEFERRKAFYSALAKEGKLLWERKMQDIDILHPGLLLYDIGPAK